MEMVSLYLLMEQVGKENGTMMSWKEELESGEWFCLLRIMLGKIRLDLEIMK
jgi:hypothetical protein